MPSTEERYVTPHARQTGMIPPFGYRERLSSWQLAVLGTILLVSTIFALVTIQKLLGTVAESANSQDSVQAVISRSVSLNLPNLQQYILMSDDEIKTALTSGSDTVYDLSANSGSGIKFIKLPPDITLIEGAAYYKTGIKNLDAVSAVKVLYGSWDIVTIAASGTRTIKLHYADFTSGSLSGAITNAISAEFNTSNVTKGASGVDDSGNTYQSGTVVINKVTYNWTVSACALSGIYAINGLPANAIYVGVKISS
jgi:hypothetical protein